MRLHISTAMAARYGSLISFPVLLGFVLAAQCSRRSRYSDNTAICLPRVVMGKVFINTIWARALVQEIASISALYAV